MPIEDQTISQADIAETFSKMLYRAGRVKKDVLPDQNEWGVDVLYSKSKAGLMQFHWVTPDMLECNMDFDMLRLKEEGKMYIQSRIELIQMQIEAARKERQRDNSIIIHNSQSGIVSTPEKDPAPVEKPLASAVSAAVKGNETVH